MKAQECDDSITYESIMEKTDLLYQYWGDGNKDKATEIALDLEKDLKNMPATVEKRLLEDVESQPPKLCFFPKFLNETPKWFSYPSHPARMRTSI
ncbi:hypothetical protein [Faecalicoccus pleomorphus]|uniref:hypothetical protein n=1 Tax=Faecalicoccus pleomorphus TaxID=1323 RepID=UPI0039F4F699